MPDPFAVWATMPEQPDHLADDLRTNGLREIHYSRNATHS